MTVAIMQPYFMPYLGYFALINAVDNFIIFDTPQFIRHGWIERNKVLKLDGESMYIKVPLKKHSRDTFIKDISINNNLDWQSKILAQLVHYKKKAPYYNIVVDILNQLFLNEFSSIVDLNLKAIKLINDYLEISTPIEVWSKMNVNIDEVKAPDEWALNISKKIGAKTYINPQGGMTFFNSEKYERENVKLFFLEYLPKTYTQFSNEFVPFLSILDVLMFCDKSEVKEMLTNYKLIEK